jgi:integration host factor subunit alpha
MSDTIASGESVKLASFGVFTVRQKQERVGRNPKTGVVAPIAPRRVVIFKASPIMKRQINDAHPIAKDSPRRSADLRSEQMGR